MLASQKSHNPAAGLLNPVDESGLSQCFHTFHAQLHLLVAPMFMNSPTNGIKAQHLDPMVMSYFPPARGVVLLYLNITLGRDNIGVSSEGDAVTLARIEGSTPFTFMWVLVDFLVWRPQVGDQMEGYIYMQTASHLGLLVHDTFNASIKRHSVPRGWEFVPYQEDELVDEQSQQIKSLGYWSDEQGNRVEGKIRFTVKNIHLSSKVLSLDGSLFRPGKEQESQPVRRQNPNAALTTSAPSKHLKFDEDHEGEQEDKTNNDNEEEEGGNASVDDASKEDDTQGPAYEDDSGEE